MKTAVMNKERAVSREEFAGRFVRVFSDAEKMARGEKTLPHSNIDEALKRWQRWAEEA